MNWIFVLVLFFVFVFLATAVVVVVVVVVATAVVGVWMFASLSCPFLTRLASRLTTPSWAKQLGRVSCLLHTSLLLQRLAKDEDTDRVSCLLHTSLLLPRLMYR